jgi:hypothetical protein
VAKRWGHEVGKFKARFAILAKDHRFFQDIITPDYQKRLNNTHKNSICDMPPSQVNPAALL